MHLGNVYSAVMSWLSARKRGGEWILRMEDLDRQRCKEAYSAQLLDDVRWLGLKWDNCSLDGGLPREFFQSSRSRFYERAFQSLCEKGLVYDCFCRRADLLAASAPHAEDGTPVYAGTCRSLGAGERALLLKSRAPAQRLMVEDKTVSFIDGHFGRQDVNLAHNLGDFVIRRADGTFSYQLAVVVDDAFMGVSEVVRGRDLLPSAAAQTYLHKTLCHTPPAFSHVPLLLGADGRRLSKRDGSSGMDELRSRFSREELIGTIMFLCGCTEKKEAMSLDEAVSAFSWERVRHDDVRVR